MGLMKRNILYMAGALLSSAILAFGCSDDIPSYREMAIDKAEVFIQADGDNPTAAVNITSGNGNYKVTVADENIATATINGTQIIVNGLKNGLTTATVMDWAKQSTVFTIKVKEDFDLELDKTELTMIQNINTTALVNIVSGNGGYRVASNNDEIATAELTEEGKVLITALSEGFADITVTDADGKKAIVKVISCEHELTLEDTSEKVWVATIPATFKIISGNGNYTVASENPEIATAEVTEEADGDVISVTGIAKGETSITVTDKMGLTATAKIKVISDFTVETTHIDNVWIKEEPQQIAIIDGSGNYTIEAGSSLECTLSKDKSTFEIKGVEKKMAFNQTIKITDNTLAKSIEITVGLVDYKFEAEVARWYINGNFGVPGASTIDKSGDRECVKVGEWYKPIFGSGYIRNGYAIYFEGRTVGEKLNVKLCPLNNSGKEGAEIQIHDVRVEKIKFDEGRGEEGLYWIKFREEGREEDSYIVAWT